MSNPPPSSLPNSPGWSRWIERLRAVTAGRYKIIRELGRGGFAAVFLAQQLKPSRRVAIKLLLPSHLDSQWVLEHFRGESQKIAEWRHQAVVTIFEVHEVEDMFFFVMSYVEGASLHDLIQSMGPLPVSIVRSVLAQMGSALQYAHKQGVTHRDIKPQNVLIDTDGGAVVTDFGISKQAGGTSHTVTGMIFGTPPYMAPEQCESSTTSHLSDQYALGIVAYEMLVGAPPFTGQPMQVLIAHMQDDVPPIAAARSDVPAEMEAAIMRMLAKNPEDRFASVAEAVHAAGALELTTIDPDRQRFAQAARDASEKMSSQAIDLISIPPMIEVGDQIPIEANARTLAGKPVTSGTVKWSVDNMQVAKVDASNGTLTALEAGVATIVVRGEGGVEQQIRVDVVAPRAATIQLRAPSGPLRIGERTQLNASALSKNGLPVSANPTWVSDDPRLATVTPDGVLQAHGAGRTKIRAQIGEVTSEFWLDVAAAEVSEVRINGAQSALTVGGTRQLTAVVLDTNDHTMPEKLVQWSSSDRKIATVSSQGLVTASAAGSITITATCDAKSATFSLTVAAAQAAHVELQKPQGKTQVGNRTRLRAIARDAAGNEVDGRPINWLSEDPSIAQVGADGTLTAVGAGTVRVSATIDGVTASASIEIERGVGGATHRATGGGTAKKGGAGKWIGIGLGVAAVGALAFVLLKPKTEPSQTTSVPAASTPPASAPAAAAVTPPATDAGRASTPPQTPVQQKQVASTPPSRGNAAVKSLRVTSPLTMMTVGDTVTVRAAVSDGTAPTGLRWTSSDPSHATVTPNGLVRGTGDGSAMIVALSGTMADSVRLDVRPKPVAAPAPTVSAPPPVVTPPRDSTPPVQRPVNNPPPVAAPDLNAIADREVRAVVAEYAAALTSRNIGAVAKVFPTMSKPVRDGWTTLFDFGRDLKVTYRVESVELAGRDAATLRVTGDHAFTNRDTKKACRLPVNLAMKMARGGSGWAITSVEQIGSQPGC